MEYRSYISHDTPLIRLPRSYNIFHIKELLLITTNQSARTILKVEFSLTGIFNSLAATSSASRIL